MSEDFSKNSHRPTRWCTRELVISVLFLCLKCLPGLAYAISCGDTIFPGESVVLDSDLIDCTESPALTIVGRADVDLNDKSISCALASDGNSVTTNSIGIQVEGQKARVRNGKIENCYTGVRVEGSGKHKLYGLVVLHTVDFKRGEDFGGFGLLVLSNRNRFTENTILNISGEGFVLGQAENPLVSAKHNILKQNVVSGSGDHAYRIKNGTHNLLLHNVAEDSVTEGFRSQDRYNKFIRNVATDCGDEGFRLRGMKAEKNLLIGNFAQGNGFPPFSRCNPFPLAEADVNPGIAATRGASKNTIVNNTLIGNCVGIGVEIGSRANKIVKNTALANALFDLADQNPECDGTIWKNNSFERSASLDTTTGDFIEDPECIE